MSLKEGMEMVKMSGMPIEMIQPVLELVQSFFDEEINLNIFTSTGFKITLKTPGLMAVLAQFLS